MLLKLSARGLTPLSTRSGAPFVARVCEDPARAESERSSEILLVARGEALPVGFRGYLLRERSPVSDRTDVYLLGAEHGHLRAGDVVRIDPTRGELTALFRSVKR